KSFLFNFASLSPQFQNVKKCLEGSKQASYGSGNSTNSTRASYPKLKCNCKNDAVIRTVKNGPNVGSMFYGCPMWPDTKCQMFKLIDGNNVDVEDLQFRLLEKDTTIAELEMIQKFRDDKINKLQLKKEKLEEELKELHNENCKLRMDLMKSTTNEKNMFLGLIVFLILVIVVYIFK
ncbi:DNA topoisomerase 3-alpha, partial [Bienertia sinuspersici]